MVLSENDKNHIRSIWGYMSSNAEAFGGEALTRLFAAHPPTKTYFLHFDLTSGSVQVKAHGRKVIEALTQAINNLDDMVGALAKLSDLHTEKLRVDSVNFGLLGHCILVTIAAHNRGPLNTSTLLTGQVHDQAGPLVTTSLQGITNAADNTSKHNKEIAISGENADKTDVILAGEFLKTDYLFVVVGQVGGACSDVQQTILQVDQYDKRDKLVEILANERTMVFVETKKKADFIATFLCQEHIPTTSIHGDREQREREEALHCFRSGKCPVLVATSVAARGLDIENVQHVINFDLPSTIDEYVHRIGRTGRCGNIGKAVSFFDSHTDSPIAQPLVKVLADAQQEVPAWLEEIACGACGIGFSIPRRNMFASVDSRKVFHGKENEHRGGNAASKLSAADESWD
ncbi:hypothetical protein JD844_008544 [Phrynosoma platyrhinos]|uniref:Uncharacterized protein n=1 Tax=Phrynosoma platyrhinos TaxID=52577 RepID=A0ABQ7TE91_PHRPL|nr:hypothetical protein JD844_008544 [Phrynosoma platyrhinos]